MTSPPSGSSGALPSSAFDLLAPGVRRWVYDQGWPTLRDAQEAAIPILLAGTEDMIIAAATASGKTEAAFLPICSQLITDPGNAESIRALYVAPLKALINDQQQRLSALCEYLDIPVHSWHGDVPGAKKAAVRAHPQGILLITPESLEALFVLRGTSISMMFRGLRYVIIDELHSFLGTERGAQLGSLLHRIELAIRHRVPRIGLSATLGDMRLAAAALRPGEADRVRCIISEEGSQQLSVQTRGYLKRQPIDISKDNSGDGNDAENEIAADLFRVLRGTHNLVFANSRKEVELYAARLRDMSETARVPNEFIPHHGNLSKELRESAEFALKDSARPTTAIATTTLEMGIDIGSVQSIAQVGAPPSVAALRQRLGRSGRRGEPAVLRIYVTEPQADARTALADQLRAELVQSIAMLRLLVAGWCEPPAADALHLSTLIQQLLSAIAQHGGVTPSSAYGALCGPGSSFAAVSSALFVSLLHSLGKHDVLTQTPDGTLLLGTVGERTVNHYSFYAAFVTSEEYRLFAEGQLLGTTPVDFPLYEGLFLIFGGRRWKVISVDEAHKIVELVPARGGNPPESLSRLGGVHDRVRTEMRTVLAASDVVPYLSPTAVDLLAEARDAFHRYGLGEHRMLQFGADTVLVPWVGSRATFTLAAQLTATGLDASNDGLTITMLHVTKDDVRSHLHRLVTAGPADPVALAGTIANKASEKYDHWLDQELLAIDYGRRSLDCDGAWRAAGALLDMP
jgi:ATP-dependent helicase Lhr and Lhr-like helicase